MTLTPPHPGHLWLCWRCWWPRPSWSRCRSRCAAAVSDVVVGALVSQSSLVGRQQSKSKDVAAVVVVVVVVRRSL